MTTGKEKYTVVFSSLEVYFNSDTDYLTQFL